MARASGRARASVSAIARSIAIRARTASTSGASGIASSSVHRSRSAASRWVTGRPSRFQAVAIVEKASIARTGCPPRRNASSASWATWAESSFSSFGRGLGGVAEEDRCSNGRFDVVGDVVDGASIELEGLAVGGQPRGIAGAGQGGIEGLATEAGALVMDRGVDLRCAFEPRPELTRPGMEPATLRVRDRPVQRVAQQLMTEVVQPAQARRVEDELVDQLLERRVQLARAACP